MENDIIILICTIIGTGIAIVSSMVGLFRYYIKKENEHAINIKRLNDIEKRSNELPCEHHHSDIIAIKSVLVQKYPNSANVFSMKASPRKLNEVGERLFNEIKGREFLEKNKDELFSSIKKNNPLTALDVEQYAYTSLLFYTNLPMFNELKDFVYNAPSMTIKKGEKYDIALNDICFILSLPLRDMYLKENTNIADI